MRSLFIYTLLFLSILFTSCGEKKQEQQSNKNEDQVKTTTEKPVFSEKKLVKSYNDCNIDSANCSYIEIKFVEMTSGSAKDNINKHINEILLNMYPLNDSSYGSVNDMATGFIKDYENAKKEFPDIPGDWYLGANLKDTAGTNKIISLKQNFDMFTGGAHPVYYEYFYNFNAETGDSILLKDIFKEGFEKELTDMVVAKFRKDQNLAADKPLTEAGLFEDSLSYNNNFLLAKEGITFHYNIYEIWSYAQGTLDIFIPYADLKAILKENGLY